MDRIDTPPKKKCRSSQTLTGCEGLQRVELPTGQTRLDLHDPRVSTCSRGSLDSRSGKIGVAAESSA
jgi:hypothetical protein